MPDIFNSSIYKGVIDAQAIQKSQKQLTELFFYELDRLKTNQYLLTADEMGIQEAEKMFGIIPDLQTENIDFRRQRVINRNTTKPPYTYGYLKMKLDEIFGSGNYSLRREPGERTIYVESAIENSQWYVEASLTVNRLKPANMIYINNPFIKKNIVVGEKIQYGNKIYNYRLDTSWQLGRKSFMSVEGGGNLKMPEIKSITEEYLKELAAFSAEDVVYARINGAVLVTELLRSAAGSEGTVEYTVTKEQAAEITKVELLSESGAVLTCAAVYVPVNEPVLMKHRIAFTEGGA